MSPALALPPGYTITDLETHGGFRSDALDVNSAGDVVGFVTHKIEDRIDDPEAVIWRGGVATGLPNLPGRNVSIAHGINDLGQGAGYSALSLHDAFKTVIYYHAALWQDDQVVDLGTLGGDESRAYDINNHGQVVGRSELADTSMVHAFLWESGTMIDLGTLGGTRSHAWAINDSGQVVGWSAINEYGDRHGFLWENGTMTDLGPSLVSIVRL